MELPREFQERMKEYLGDDYQAFISSYTKKPVRALHVNTLKITTDKLKQLYLDSIEQIDGLKDSFIWHGDDKVGKEPLHHAGAFYMQEPSAMLPIYALPIKEGMKVLDMCAAPGGKSTQIANQLNGSGVLVCNEYDSKRVQILQSNLERMGVQNAITTNANSKQIATAFTNYFDAVVVDAPCSGEGMFRKDDEAILDWNQGNVELCRTRQKEILSDMANVLVPGGYLLYSTCTFSKEEDEEQVYAFLDTHPDFHLVKVSKETLNYSFLPLLCRSVGDDECMRRVYPHGGFGEGQFFALLQKNPSDILENTKRIPNDQIRSLNNEERGVWEEFEKNTLSKPLQTPIVYKNKLYLIPEKAVIPKDILFSPGVCLGEVIKGRFEPSHYFFMAYGTKCKRTISLNFTSKEAELYLRGEVLPTTIDSGWASVLMDGCSVGGVKVSCGVAKNHYPKGLRLLK